VKKENNEKNKRKVNIKNKTEKVLIRNTTTI
jgi:hypothetical protein